jgi:flagellar hook-associated protein 2
MTTSSTSSSSSSIYGQLDQTWVQLIQTQINSEKTVRLNRLSKQNNDLDLRKAVFTDLSSQITDLKNTLGKLWSSNASYALSGAHSVSVTNPSTSGATVFSAVADSTAALGSYNISVTNPASQHRVASTTKYTSSTTALGYSGSFSITLGGKTNQFSVDANDTLYSIASKINSATYDTGKGISASVVNNTLTLESVSSGNDFKMTLADVVAGGPLEKLGIINSSNTILPASQLQDGVDAVFTVNGISVTRSKNTGLTDVINGVTLNLASDSKGNSATLTVLDDTASMKTALQNFISKYNALQTYLANKTGYTKTDEKHYTPGALANELSVRSLKADLSDQVSFSAGNGVVKFFGDMGISLSKNQLSITDSTKLDNALKNNMSDVKTFLDAKMSRMSSQLDAYVGKDSSLVNYTIKSLTEQKSRLTQNIDNENKRLEARRSALISYYQGLQAKITSDSNTTSALSSYIYASMYPSSSK